jgi:ABC-type maltose transport system permease subunit
MSQQIFHDSDDLAHKANGSPAAGDLRRPDPLGDHLPVPDLLDHHHLVQDGARRDAREPDPLGRLQPKWLGLASLGLSPDTIGTPNHGARGVLKRFFNSVITSLSASALAVALGSLAAYGLSRFSYRSASCATPTSRSSS